MKMANLDEISTVIDKNDICSSVVGSSSETRVIQRNSLFRLIRERKFIWIFFSILLIISTIISTILIIKTNSKVNTTTISASIITTTENEPLYNRSIIEDMKWKQNGTTVVGGNRMGAELNQLYFHRGIYVDDNQTIYIADVRNHHIVKWISDLNIGQVVAGGNGRGRETKQLNNPTDVIVDKENDVLIICDLLNTRVMQWSRQNNTNGEIIISDIFCTDLAMDNKGYLYVAIAGKGEVKRWRIGDVDGIIVAGRNQLGDHMKQLSSSIGIFIDQDYSVYVSDEHNDRVMKWIKDAKEGVIVAGGSSDGHKLKRLSHPTGVFVDQLGSVFVVDSGNARIVRWLKSASLGSIIVEGNGIGAQANQFRAPSGLSFDEQGDIYVVDSFNHRVQQFSIDSSN